MRLARFTAFLAVAALAAPAPVFAQQSPFKPRPVMVGGDADLDACGGVGRVVRLKRGGDNFLSVRTAPNVKAAEKDKLGPSARVFLCDEAVNGSWYGVVYMKTKNLDGCGVTSPVPQRRSYRGPCAYGWVSAAFIELIAG